MEGLCLPVLLSWTGVEVEVVEEVVEVEAEVEKVNGPLWKALIAKVRVDFRDENVNQYTDCYHSSEVT